MEPEALLPGDGEGAAARHTVGESIMEFKARMMQFLRKLALEQDLDEDSEEYKEYLLDIKENVKVMRLRLRSEIEALENPSRKPVARRARGYAGAVCSAHQPLFCCCLTLPDAHTPLCRCLPAAVDELYLS